MRIHDEQTITFVIEIIINNYYKQVLTMKLSELTEH